MPLQGCFERSAQLVGDFFGDGACIHCFSVGFAMNAPDPIASSSLLASEAGLGTLCSIQFQVRAFLRSPAISHARIC